MNEDYYAHKGGGCCRIMTEDFRVPRQWYRRRACHTNWPVCTGHAASTLVRTIINSRFVARRSQPVENSGNCISAALILSGLNLWKKNKTIYYTIYHFVTLGIGKYKNISIPHHYIDVIMSAISSQITSLTIVHSIVYSDADQRKHQSSASLAIVRGIHRDPEQMASNAENVSIWWRHHDNAMVIYDLATQNIGSYGTDLVFPGKFQHHND